MAENSKTSGSGGSTTDNAKQKASQAQDRAEQKASELQNKAQEKTEQAKERVLEGTEEEREKARGVASEQLDKRSTQAGERVRDVGVSMRDMSSTLRDEGQSQVADYVDQAAERVDRVGSYLKDSGGDRIIGDIEDLARRNPWAFAAGGLVLGVAAARFLKTSGKRSAAERRGGSEAQYAGRYDSRAYGDPYRSGTDRLAIRPGNRDMDAERRTTETM